MIHLGMLSLEIRIQLGKLVKACFFHFFRLVRFQLFLAAKLKENAAFDMYFHQFSSRSEGNLRNGKIDCCSTSES